MPWRERGAAAGSRLLVASLILGVVALPAAGVRAQPAAAPVAAEPEMPPLPSLEGQQGEVISHSAVSAPARKHRPEEPKPVAPAPAPVAKAPVGKAPVGKTPVGKTPGRPAAPGAKPAKAVKPTAVRMPTAKPRAARPAAPRRRR